MWIGQATFVVTGDTNFMMSGINALSHCLPYQMRVNVFTCIQLLTASVVISLDLCSMTLVIRNVKPVRFAQLGILYTYSVCSYVFSQLKDLLLTVALLNKKQISTTKTKHFHAVN